MAKSDARKARPARRRPFRWFAIIGLVVTVVAAGLLYRFTSLPPVFIYFLALSGCAFLLCGYDKQVAGGESTRVPENVLFGAALVGGTPGLLLGMKVFRHKTRKRSFQLVVAAIMVTQIALVCGYFAYLVR